MALKQALVFGASGISGWAITRGCLQYPNEETFGRVIALSKQQLRKEQFLMCDSNLEKLELVFGIDLMNDGEVSLCQFAAIAGIENTTHVFYAAYAGHRSDYLALKKINVDLFERALQLLLKHCPNLEFFSLQTGAKTYGFEFYGQPGMDWITPHKESQPRIPEPYASNIFYYPQVDMLTEAAKGQKWKYCEIRPDAIIGFALRSNGMGFAQSIGIFLSIWSGKNLHTDTSQDLLAKFHIFASLHPEATGGAAFNIGDSEGIRWESVWPELCAYFGLKGVGPRDAATDKEKLVGLEWILARKKKWRTWIEENGLNEGFVETASSDMFAWLLQYIPFDRNLDLTRSKEIGFQETVRTVEGYFTAFERMREAKIIP